MLCHCLGGSRNLDFVLDNARAAATRPEQTLHLFLDTNTYLGFFRLSDDDLGELEKLVVAVRAGKTVLYLPDQVRNEFVRNRSATISDALKAVEVSKLPSAFPRLMTNLPGYDALRAALRAYEDQRKTLLAEARTQAREGRLAADPLISELFRLAMGVPLSDAIYQAAARRHSVGDPPGKKDSLGDAINWESLLVVVPTDVELIIVSGDGDYASKLDNRLLDEFLAAEWKRIKGSRITLETGLTALFRSYYPDIQLAADLEKELAIDALIASPNFRSTHLAVQKLSNYVDFSPAQVKAIVEAAKTNNQVSQILADADVLALFSDLCTRYPDQIDVPDAQWLQGQVEPTPAGTA